MSDFQIQFDKIRQLIVYENYTQLTKRIIDLTLDAEDVAQYRRTVTLLDWLDENQKDIPQIKEQLQARLYELYEVLKDKPLQKETPPKPILKIENLIRSYSNSGFALGPVSFELNEGEILGLVGENGNGKTTMLRSLCGELLATSGIVHYCFPYNNDYDLRSQLVYIPQRTDSWHGSLLTNLQFTATTYGLTGDENEMMVQLVIARMGLRKYRSYYWKNLSSGYKMRFELARALLRRPKLLLIDEPLANLDIVAQQVVLDDFGDIARSPFRPLGIVLSSQQLYEVEKASDKVIFLKNGSPRNLLTDTDVTIQEIPKFIVEFETEIGQEKLYQLLQQLNLEKLQLNGGTFVATFPFEVSCEQFLKFTLNHSIQLIYFRNISNSTRRFFLT